MDTFLTAALSALPSLGIYAGFGWVLLLLLRREGSAEERHAKELDRLRKAHDEELEELRTDVRNERAARRVAEQERDEARGARP